MHIYDKMFKFFNKNRVRQLGGNGPNSTLASNVYLRDFYVKDFKYISPEVLPKKLGKRKTALEVWFAEVFRGLKQFFCEGSLHGVK